MKQRLPSFWRGFIILPLVAGLAALATFYFLPPKAPPPPPPPGGEQEALRPIGVPQAAELHQDGMVFLDARDEASFRQGRIAGARLLVEPEPWAGLAVVVYGQGDDMDQVLAKAEALVRAGAEPVHVLLEGFLGWQAAGLAVDAGD